MSTAAEQPRRGLGRGLEVLIGGATEPELAHLPVETIHPNPRQPRRRFDAEATTALSDSIKAQGIVQPVLVRPRAAGGFELIRARLNPRLAIAGVILTMVDRRTRLAADVDAEVRRHFGNLVFNASIPRSVRIAEAPSHGLPVTAYDRRSAGADAYWKVAMELVDRS